MRFVPVLLLAVAPALHAQSLGSPMSSLPGVEAGVSAVVGNAVSGGVDGIRLPQATLERLMMAPAATGRSSAIGQQIERSFHGDGTAQADEPGYGLQGRAAGTITGESVSRTTQSGSVTGGGTAVQLPSSQQLMPANLIPGYQSVRNSNASATGVENVYTGSGVPRSGTAP